MANKTTAQLRAYKDANITSNGINSNTGANHNTFLEDLLDSIANRTTDATLFGLFTYDTGRSYIIGQGVMYATNLYVCTTNTTGTWNSGHWLQLTFGQIDVRRDREAVTKGGTDIAFSSDLGSSGTSYSLTFNCAEADGGGVECGAPVAERTKSGFKVYPAKNGFIDWAATLI